MLDRLHDDVTDDDVAAAHDEDGGDQADREQQGPVTLDTLIDVVRGDGDFQDCYDIADLQCFISSYLFVALHTGFTGPHRRVIVDLTLGQQQEMGFILVGIVLKLP